MTATKAKRLLTGTIVIRNGDQDDKGTVRSIGWTGFQVDWEHYGLEWIGYGKAKRIEVY